MSLSTLTIFFFLTFTPGLILFFIALFAIQDSSLRNVYFYLASVLGTLGSLAAIADSIQASTIPGAVCGILVLLICAYNALSFKEFLRSIGHVRHNRRQDQILRLQKQWEEYARQQYEAMSPQSQQDTIVVAKKWYSQMNTPLLVSNEEAAINYLAYRYQHG